MFLFVWQPPVLHRRHCVCVGASRFCNCNQTITSAIFLENFVGSGAKTHYATKSLNEWTVSYFKIIHLNINCVCLLHLLSCYWQIRQNYTRLNVCACILRAFSAVFFSLCFFFSPSLFSKLFAFFVRQYAFEIKFQLNVNRSIITLSHTIQRAPERTEALDIYAS